MCGILFARKSDGNPVAKIIYKRYRKQSSRGTDGFGYIAVEDGYVREVIRDETEKGILDKLKKETASEIMFHHRYPTSTENYEEVTHPIVVEQPFLEHKYYVVHNGVLHNQDVLKEKHSDLGAVYNTEYEKKETETTTIKFIGCKEEVVEDTVVKTTKFNDSEAFAIELAMYIEGLSDKIDITGSASFLAYQTKKDGKIIAMYSGHNAGNPMILEYVRPRKERKGRNKNKSKDNNMIVIKSLGNGIKVKENVLFRIDYESNKITEEDVEIGKSYTYPIPETMGSKNIYGFHDQKYLPSRAPDKVKRGDTGDATDGDENTRREDGLDSWSNMGMFGTINEQLDEQFAIHEITDTKKRLVEIEEELIVLTAEKKDWRDSFDKSSDVSFIGEMKMEINTIQKEIEGLIYERGNLEDLLLELEGGKATIMSDELQGILT